MRVLGRGGAAAGRSPDGREGAQAAAALEEEAEAAPVEPVGEERARPASRRVGEVVLPPREADAERDAVVVQPLGRAEREAAQQEAHGRAVERVDDVDAAERRAEGGERGEVVERGGDARVRVGARQVDEREGGQAGEERQRDARRRQRGDRRAVVAEDRRQHHDGLEFVDVREADALQELHKARGIEEGEGVAHEAEGPVAPVVAARRGDGQVVPALGAGLPAERAAAGVEGAELEDGSARRQRVRENVFLDVEGQLTDGSAGAGLSEPDCERIEPCRRDLGGWRGLRSFSRPRGERFRRPTLAARLGILERV